MSALCDLEGLIANLDLSDNVLLRDGRGDVAQADRIRRAVGLLNSVSQPDDGELGSCLDGMRMLRVVLSETPPPIDAILESGAAPLIIHYLRPAVVGNTPELVFEASWAMLNLMSGDERQVLKAIHSTDTVSAALELLANQHLSCATREHAAWMLSNIAGTGHAYRVALIDRSCFALLVQFVLDCIDAPFNPSNGIWALGNLARPLNECVPDHKGMVHVCATLVEAVRRLASKPYQVEAIHELLQFLYHVVNDDTLERIQSLNHLEPLCRLVIDVGRMEFRQAVESGCLAVNVNVIRRLFASETGDPMRMFLLCGGLGGLASYAQIMMSPELWPSADMRSKLVPLMGIVAELLDTALSTEPSIAADIFRSFPSMVGVLCDALPHFTEQTSGIGPRRLKDATERLVRGMWLVGLRLLCASESHPEAGARLFVAMTPTAAIMPQDDVYCSMWLGNAVSIGLIHATTLHAQGHEWLQPLLEALAIYTDSHMVTIPGDVAH